MKPEIVKRVKNPLHVNLYVLVAGGNKVPQPSVITQHTTATEHESIAQPKPNRNISFLLAS